MTSIDDLVNILHARSQAADQRREAKGSGPLKAQRRTKGEMEALRALLYKVVEADRPMTVRQVFYRMVSLGVIDKTEMEYKQTVGKQLTRMRRDWTIPYEWIADESRWMRKPRSYDSVEDALRQTAQFYRRRLWSETDAYVEVWLEKEALAGVLYAVTAEWDVPLMVTRGYPSLTFLHEAAQTIAAEGKPTFLYYFGDWDPSGVGIPRKVEQELREFLPDVDITFERVAVTPEQVEAWGLPTRPTKKTDSRSKNFEGDSIEVDAIPPARLRQLANDVIDRHVDDRVFQVVAEAEESERELLYGLAGQEPVG